MDKGERLSAAYEYLKEIGRVKNVDDVAKAVGRSKNNISSALNGNTRYLSDKFLSLFDMSFGNIFNIDWLIKGEGTMLANDINDVTSISADNNKGIVNNGSGNKNIIDIAPARTEHDALIKSTATIDSMKAIVETVGDPSLAIELIGKILGVKPKKDDTSTTD